MTAHLNRREFLRRGAGIVAGAAALSLVRPAVVGSQAPDLVRADDLVDAGEAFRRGSTNGVTVAGGPDGPTVQAQGAEGVFTSPALRSSIKFTHVGLHWVAIVPPQATLIFEVRTSSDGSTWSPWRAVRVDCLPGRTPAGDPNGFGHSFGSLIYARDAWFVQYRAIFRTAGGASPSLQRVTATVIDSPIVSTTARDQLPIVSVSDGEPSRTLAVTAREQWGADESYRFKRGQEIWPEMFVPAKKLIVHHTATRNDYATGAEAAAEVRAIYRYHAVTKQWGDIGYGALVDKFGNVYEGRHGRGGDPGDQLTTREILSRDVVAGHDYAHNYGTVGVALLGDATLADWPMPSATGSMWDALVRSSVFEAGRHHLCPLNASGTIAVADFLRSDDAWSNLMRNVSGHRETNSTTCPGDVVMGLLDALRQAIRGGLTGTSRTGVRLTNLNPGGRETVVNTAIVYSWEAEPPEPQDGWTVVGYESCFEGWFKPSRSEDIQYLSGYTPDQQPRRHWTSVERETTSASFTPTAAGHYTFHVRARLQNNGNETERPPSAYAGSHTFLVKSSATGGRKPR